jgi:hypothetical protein
MAAILPADVRTNPLSGVAKQVYYFSTFFPEAASAAVFHLFKEHR